MTTSGGPRRRGEPLAALALVIASWTGVRAMLWDAAGGLQPPEVVPLAAAAPGAFEVTTSSLPGKGAQRTSEPVRFARVTGLSRWQVPASPAALAPPLAEAPFSPIYLPPSPAYQAPLPSALAASGRPDAASHELPTSRAPPRWRVDGWAAWRQGSGLPQLAAGAGPASYGASQAGLAARYQLGTGRRLPALHLRASYAPGRPRQAELALGAGARPLASLPVRAQAELRATMTAGKTELRPAAFAVTELSPAALPLGFAAEAYAQAGWVGGRYATPFADGQARVTRTALQAGPLRLSGGAGAWGGAQRFAGRLDVGPTIEMALPKAPAPLRLSVDYRFRVAGRAEPGNGIAVTLASGF